MHSQRAEYILFYLEQGIIPHPQMLISIYTSIRSLKSNMLENSCTCILKAMKIIRKSLCFFHLHRALLGICFKRDLLIWQLGLNLFTNKGK